jgi:hypothetical protein
MAIKNRNRRFFLQHMKALSLIVVDFLKTHLLFGITSRITLTMDMRDSTFYVGPGLKMWDTSA